MIRALTVALGVTLATPGFAAPPPSTDLNSPMHAWFERQHSVAGQWCCDIADGHILSESDWRASGGGFEVRINGRWVPVPSHALRDPAGGPNPTGNAIVWYSVSGDLPTIFCFAPGWQF